jgi:pimeloyl-ACP methyl ester carboxylesterase
MNNIKLIFALLSALLVVACSPEPSTDLQDSIDAVTPETVVEAPTALFDPSNSVIPFPNNLLFGGSTDGTLNIPVADEDDLSDPQVALNALDGFSTVAPMSSGFSTTIDSATVNATSVRVYQVTLSGPGGAVVAINSQLTFGVDYIATLSSVDPSQSTLVVLPLKPLAAKTSYLVVVTDDLKTSSGEAFGPSLTYRLIKNLPDPLVFGSATLPGALRDLNMEELASFEQLRQIVNISEATAAGFDAAIEVSDIIVSWSFTTQSIGDVLAEARNSAIAGTVPPNPVLFDSGADSPFTGAPGYVGADIYVGSMDVPYYLTAAANKNDPTPLGSFWKGAGGKNLGGNTVGPVVSPVATSTQTIPLMLSIPKSGKPAAGYPVVIYQHGITTNRATMLAVADAFANLVGLPGVGHAVIAIDLPMHGVTGNETDGTQAFKTPFERTFDLDLVTQDADGNITAEVPDGITDSSGRHFINLTNLLNSRDNLRQSVADLMALYYAMDDIAASTPGCTNPCLDSSKVYFLGHSLGAIVGTTFTALEPGVQDAVFAFGGGGVAKILDGSASFGPSIAAGLAANGVVKGTPDYESFLGAAQTVIDSGDAINYAGGLQAKGEGILYFEIVGGAGSPSDLVVPNTVPDANDTANTVPAPLAGTEPVLTLLGLTQTNTAMTGANLKVSVKYTAGEHSSLLDPGPSLAVTTQLQTQAAIFIGTSGSSLPVTDGSILQAP